jgi:hypothetical protein
MIKALSIDLPPIGETVTIRAEGDEVVVVVTLCRGEGDNVVKLDFDVSARRDGASMAGLNENAPFNFLRDARPVHFCSMEPTAA